MDAGSRAFVVRRTPQRIRIKIPRWARQMVSAQRTRDHSTRAISLVGLAVKLTIAIATSRFDTLIRELILEAAVQALMQQLYRKLMRSPRLERPPRALLVAAVG